MKNQNEIIQSTTLTEKIIEDLSGRQPVAFCKLIAKCLSVDPSKRPSAVEALAWENAFVGTDEDEDILAYEKASTPTMTRWRGVDNSTRTESLHTVDCANECIIITLFILYQFSSGTQNTSYSSPSFVVAAKSHQIKSTSLNSSNKKSNSIIQTNTLFVVVVVKVFFSFHLLRVCWTDLKGRERIVLRVKEKSCVGSWVYWDLQSHHHHRQKRRSGKLWTTPQTISLLLLLCFSLR